MSHQARCDITIVGREVEEFLSFKSRKHVRPIILPVKGSGNFLFQGKMDLRKRLGRHRSKMCDLTVSLKEKKLTTPSFEYTESSILPVVTRIQVRRIHLPSR